MDWKLFKQQKEKSLAEAFEKGEGDKEILPLLKKINRHKEWVTTSSCFGRIVLLEFAAKKKESSFYIKWHRKVQVKEVTEAIENYAGKNELWFRFEPMILHVSAKDIDPAKRFLELVRSIGIKRGGIQTVTCNRASIEIQGNQGLVVPVKAVSDWKLIVKKANEMFNKNIEKMNQLKSIL